VSPRSGATYVTKVRDFNDTVPPNLFLVTGDEELEIQASRVANACAPGPTDAWRIVHAWISDLISDIRESWDVNNSRYSLIVTPVLRSIQNLLCRRPTD
jgi:chromosome partitioning protein